MNSPFAKVKSSFLMGIFRKFAIWDATELPAEEARKAVFFVAPRPPLLPEAKPTTAVHKTHCFPRSQ